jgi:hypothetical protein
VVKILLDKVAATDIKPFMTHFLNSFMLVNGLKPDTILSGYIHDILSSGWWYNAEAPLEDTVAAIIQCISDFEVQTLKLTISYSVLYKGRHCFCNPL